MITIDPSKNYSLNEIVEKQLIPGVHTYTKMYNLVTVKSPEKMPKGLNRVVALATTKYNIKPNPNSSIGTRIQGKISVSGVELIRFLSIHNLINR